VNQGTLEGVKNNNGMVVLLEKGKRMSVQSVVTKAPNVYQKKHDEKVLVVARKDLFPHETPQGFELIDFSYYQLLIETKGKFLWRSKMENDPSYKQIIPYLIFKFKNTYFLMKRMSKPGDARLSSKYSIGIGGHLRQVDMKGHSIIEWAFRELKEEVCYKGNFTVVPLGIINDELDPVGTVHTGFVFLLEGDSPAIQIHSEFEEGRLATLDECATVYHTMERWSQLMFDYLRANQP
jgi:predicted NUDIX family phosphoesterase